MAKDYPRLQRFLHFFTTRLEGDAEEILESIRGDGSSAVPMTLEDVELLTEVARAIGFLTKQDGRFVLVQSTEHAQSVVQTLTEILDSGRPLLADLERADSAETWVLVLKALENRRIVANAPPVCRREVVLSHAIVVGEHNDVRYLLVEWDLDRWGTVKPFGGKQSTGESPLQVLRRQVPKNLDKNYHLKFKLSSEEIGEKAQTTEISRRLGVLTHYVLHSFSVYGYSGESITFDGQRSAHLRWMRVEDVNLGLWMFPRCFFEKALPATVLAHCGSADTPTYAMSAEDAACRLSLYTVASRALGGTWIGSGGQ